jgi:hypothetical protein
MTTSELKRAMDRRFNRIDRRFERVDRRLDRLERTKVDKTDPPSFRGRRREHGEPHARLR